ncbi:MAG: dTDP-4-dehydrorhamnose 3,5-epimerase family protein [Bacteroidales bacterium]|nr:dTDP-4-dehydrorhamnose 3,5-epimerase family protein [Bacteroidales bacterium]
MTLSETTIKGVYVGHLSAFTDQRGLFSKLFGSAELAAVWKNRTVRQINLSETRAPGTIRGLHFQQPPHAEMKLIVCLDGQVYDVAVDLRAGSETLKQHAGILLSPLDFIIIPECCAHGFQVVQSGSRLLYVHSAEYAFQSEKGFRFDDKTLNIIWPLPPVGLSDRDLHQPTLDAAFTGISPHD